jgi:hypothetical protein
MGSLNDAGTKGWETGEGVRHRKEHAAGTSLGGIMRAMHSGLDRDKFRNLGRALV